MEVQGLRPHARPALPRRKDDGQCTIVAQTRRVLWNHAEISDKIDETQESNNRRGKEALLFSQNIKPHPGGQVDEFVTHRFPLAEINEAFHVMHKGEAIRSVLTL